MIENNSQGIVAPRAWIIGGIIPGGCIGAFLGWYASGLVAMLVGLCVGALLGTLLAWGVVLIGSGQVSRRVVIAAAGGAIAYGIYGVWAITQGRPVGVLVIAVSFGAFFGAYAGATVFRKRI